jgi:tRNA-(ms[2]io[6]A)-hydroxylase
MGVLRLQLPTDPRWVNIVEKNIEEILTDHAWCEQKAATNALQSSPQFRTSRFSVGFILAKEEIDHFEQVHNYCQTGLETGSRTQR